MGPLSGLWKVLEDVRNESPEAVEASILITINHVYTSLKYLENIVEESS